MNLGKVISFTSELVQLNLRWWWNIFGMIKFHIWKISHMICLGSSNPQRADSLVYKERTRAAVCTIEHQNFGAIPSTGMDVLGWWCQKLIFPKSSCEHASVSCQAKRGEVNLPQQTGNGAETKGEKQQQWLEPAFYVLIVKLFHCFHTRPGARNWRIKFPAPQNFRGEFICERREVVDKKKLDRTT